jgi:hypothetical protein
VEELIEVALIASLNVAVTVVLIATPVAKLAGVTAVTIGATGGVVEFVPPHPTAKKHANVRKQAAMRRIVGFSFSAKKRGPETH